MRTEVETPERAPWHASTRVRLGALAIVAVAVAVVIAVILGTGRASPPPATTVTSIGPTALTASELKILARGLNQVIYWAGPVDGDKYELTRTTANAVYVRYLPPGVKAGTHQGEYLIVATYPEAGALAALKKADNGHPLAVRGRKGAIAVVDLTNPTSVHVAFPHVDYEIEVYEPSAKKARKLATSGTLAPVA